MAITKKRLKLCLYGNIYGAYRSQNLLKILLDEGYRVAWVAPEFYQERGLKKDFVAKVAHKIFLFYSTVDLFIKAILSDVLYVLPVNIRLIKVALWISRICKTKLILEIHALLYDSLVKDQQTVACESDTAKMLKSLDVLALTQPDYLIDLAEYEIDYWADLLSVEVDKSKLFIAPLFTESISLYKKNYLPHQPLQICWWGTLIPLHGIETIIEAMHLLKAQSYSFTCNLFAIPPKGQEYLLDKYKKLIREKGLEQHVCIRPDLRFSDGSLPNFLVENCDLALGIFGTSGRARSIVPTKLIDALALGLPTLTMSTPALEEFFDTDIDLWTCEPTAESLSKCVIAITENDINQVDWLKTREKVLDIFNVGQYKSVVNTILSKISSEL